MNKKLNNIKIFIRSIFLKFSKNLSTKEGRKFFIIRLSFVFLGLYGIFSLNSYYRNKIGTEIYGNIDIREVDLGFRVAGKLQNVFVEEGDFVKEGQVLAELDKEPFEQDLKMINATLSANEAALKNAELNFNMIEDLYKMNIKSKYEYSNALMQIEQAKANLNFAKAKVSNSKIALNDGILVAPSDGIIVNRAFEKGSILNSNAKVITLSLTSFVYAKGYISETHVGKLKIGDHVVILTDSNTCFDGVLSYISPNAEFTPKTIETRELRTDLVYRVHFIIKNHENKLHRGMPVTIKIRFSDDK